MAYGGDFIAIIDIGGVSCLPGDCHSFEFRKCSTGIIFLTFLNLEGEIAESKSIYPRLLDIVNVDRCITLIELLNL